MFKNIVVGIDGSEPSERALRLACDLAQKYGSEIHLVHTPEPQTVAFATGAVAGYHAVTTMPSEEEVNVAAKKIINSGKSIAEECCTIYSFNKKRTSHTNFPINPMYIFLSDMRSLRIACMHVNVKRMFENFQQKKVTNKYESKATYT